MSLEVAHRDILRARSDYVAFIIAGEDLVDMKIESDA
jgi:hypothetical protein